MNNKEIIHSVIDAFDKNDVELILSHFDEDIQWQMVGDQTFSGKKSISEFFAGNPNMQMISSTRDHIVIDGNCAVVNGDVLCEDTSKGTRSEMYYCDIYEIENGKIKKMISYVINKSKA